MKLNKKTVKPPLRTHEGGRAVNVSAEAQLRRSVMSCLLWEDGFYESGVSIAQRIIDLVAKVDPATVAEIASEARDEMKLRHVPLLITRAMAKSDKHKHLVAATLEDVIQRPDELAEFLAIYWKDKKQPLSAQVKKGLAAAFRKFNEYQLAKYNRDGAIKLRDVLFLSHAKPENKAQEKLWKKLVEGTLEVPDTWETNLSSGADKKETFTRLIEEKKLGALALLRNLRNMREAGVDREVIRGGLSEMDVSRVLPFRFVAAARYAPEYEPELEQAMFKCLEGHEKLAGTTVIAIDTSGSMEGKVSGRSEISNRDAAATLAMILREVCEDVHVIAFGSTAGIVRPRRGFALNDEIGNGRFGHGTDVGAAVRLAMSKSPDRIIVITDEQSATNVPNPGIDHAYMINVASYKNGIGYGPWLHLDGFSENIVRYILAFENEL